jgi:uridine kinase
MAGCQYLQVSGSPQRNRRSRSDRRDRPALRHNGAVPQPPVVSRVVVLAGPSGIGKSRLAALTGLPVLRLDDFYRSGGDPELPLITHGANAGLVDWDDPRSWHAQAAVRAIVELADTGRTVAPVYDIARNGPSGTHEVTLGRATLFVAEGIFAQQIVADCRQRGVLAAAFCLRQRPLVTFWRRLTRDLREHRKPPLVLLRRGWWLMRTEPEVVAHAVACGATPMTPDEAYERLSGLVTRAPQRRE